MEFYIIDTVAVVGTAHEAAAVPVNRRLGDAPRCPLCKAYVGMLAWLPPYVVDLKRYGESVGDVAYAGGELVVSHRFRDGFDGKGLTGLTFHPVEVRRAPAECRSTGYFYAEVSLSRAAIDVGRSQLERGPVQCPGCRRMLQIERATGIFLEEDTWDGLDVFIARGFPGTPLVSQRFADMCSESKITGLVLKPAATYAFDSMPWTRSPSRWL
jgi:hypothetical protein